MDHPAVGALVRGEEGRTQGRDGTGQRLVGRGPGFEAKRHVGHALGTLGDAPVTLMFVQLNHKVTLNDACWNK